jgi:hypothetical protein
MLLTIFVIINGKPLNTLKALSLTLCKAQRHRVNKPTMQHAFRFLTFTLAIAGLQISCLAVAQPTAKVGAGQVLVAPRTADNSPPPAIGLTDAMKKQAVATNQW